MISALFLGSLLLSSTPSPAPSPPAISPEDRAAYVEAKDRAGRDPEAHVRLALWCEAHGMAAERVEHLARAVLLDPSHASARGLLGMVAYRGHWKHPEEVATVARSDDGLRATLAGYNARREGMPETAEAHWALALWCERNGLGPEAMAHFTAVTRLDPDRADAWVKLGCRKLGGRWISAAQADAEKAEADARRRADERWGVRLRAWWRDRLADPEHRAESESTLAEELEPRAVPTIRALFVEGTAEQQLAAVSLLDRIDAPEATHELARVATLGRSSEVRRGAVASLVRRDPNEVIEPLVALMHTPMAVDVARRGGTGAVARLRVEDEKAVLRKTYIQNTVRVAPAPAGRMNLGFLAPVLSPPRNNRTAGEELNRDLRTVAARNAARRAVNGSARAILAEVVGEDLGPEPESWRRWLSDRRGYAYESPDATPKRYYSRVSQHTNYQFASTGFHSNCFARGTPVRTLLGLEPIEDLRVGDQVLTEDPGTGALSYRPVVVVYHNPPSPTLRIALDGEEIVATPIHRFWRVGKGWTLARDLKPGDALRVLGGPARVAEVRPDVVQPVFNLELSDGHSFFVGREGALVHDNSRIQPASEPFDAAPTLSNRSAVARAPIE